MFALRGCYCLFGGWYFCPNSAQLKMLILAVLVGGHTVICRFWSQMFVAWIFLSLLLCTKGACLPAYPGILVGRSGQGSVLRNPGNIFTAANNPVMQSSAPDVSTLYLLILGFKTIIYFVIFLMFAQFAIEK